MGGGAAPGALKGTPVGQGGNLTRATYTLSTTLTNSLTITFYDGTGCTRPDLYLGPTSPTQGYLFVNGPFGNGVMTLTSGHNFGRQLLPSGTQSELAVRCRASYLPFGN